MPADLRASAVEYLAWRRAMGYRLSRHDGLIGQFLDYLSDQHESGISVEHALVWACLGGGPATEPERTLSGFGQVGVGAQG